MALVCRVCSEEVHEEFRATILHSHTVCYYHCDNCGFLQTESPYWLDEAYAQPINVFDTGVLSRNIALAERVAVLIDRCFDRDAIYVDYGGGYGFLTRLMRDYGYDFYWHDPRCENLVARGFEYRPGTPGVSLLTAFEVLEHIEDPIGLTEVLLKISDNIMFTTQVLPDPVPRPGEWWYYALEHGQHISFYTRETLARIASHFRLRLYAAGSIHLLTRSPLPIPAAPSGRLSSALKRSSRAHGRIFRKLLPADFETLMMCSKYFLPQVLQHTTSRTFSDMIYLRDRPPAGLCS